MIEQKLIGTTLISSAEFKDEHGIKFIPETVIFKYKNPNNIITTIIDIIPDQDMIFEIPILLDIHGTWYFRWESASGYTTAEEFQIFVLNIKL